MTLQQLTAFFGWGSIIGFGLLTASTVLIVALGNWASHLHAGLFDLGATRVRRQYFGYLALWKILILNFFVIPYFALRLAV